MNTDMKDAFLNFIAYAALDQDRKVEIVKLVAGGLSFDMTSRRLIERCKDFTTYVLIQPERQVESAAEHCLEELYGLMDLMVQSNDAQMWSEASMQAPGIWSLFRRVAESVRESIGHYHTPQVDANRLRTLIAE